MSQGREVVDQNAYKSNCLLENALAREHGVKNMHNYRYFLQKNGKKVAMQLSQCQPNVINETTCNICPSCEMAVDWKPKRA